MKKILSIDGGGIRGLMAAVVLDHLQWRLPLPLSRYFDVVGGTSTGAILAGLIRAEKANLSDFYRVHGPVIFSKKNPSTWIRSQLAKVGLVGYKYGQSYIRQQLRANLGDVRLKDVPPLVSVCQSPGNRRAWILTSDKARRDPDYDFALADAVFASAAAPAYFEPARITSAAGNTYTLVDGGLVAPNPALVGLTELVKERGSEITEVPLILSFGTGPDSAGADFSGKPAVLFAADVIDAQMASSSEMVEYTLGTLFDFFKLTDRYIRINPPVTGLEMDDASPEAIDALIEAGKQCIRENAEALDRVVELLLQAETIS